MKYASPLFILREHCERDLFGTLEKLKAIGYDGIEFLGFFGKSPEEVGDRMVELGLEALGNHVDYEAFNADPKGVIAAHKRVGCRYITISGWFGKTWDPARFTQWASDILKISLMCREEGLTLLYHNHHSEYLSKVEGEFLQDRLLREIPAEVLSFEPDLGWMAIAGASPLECLLMYKDRCPVLHLKDYYASTSGAVPGDVHALGQQRGGVDTAHFEFRPTGYGIMNYPALLEPMLACRPEWVVMDHDLAYERDSFQDLAVSLAYAKCLFSMS